MWEVIGTGARGSHTHSTIWVWGKVREDWRESTGTGKRGLTFMGMGKGQAGRTGLWRALFLGNMKAGTTPGDSSFLGNVV